MMTVCSGTLSGNSSGSVAYSVFLPIILTAFDAVMIRDGLNVVAEEVPIFHSSGSVIEEEWPASSLTIRDDL